LDILHYTQAWLGGVGPGELYYGCKDLPIRQKYLCAHSMKCCEREINVSNLSIVVSPLARPEPTSHPTSVRLATLRLLGVQPPDLVYTSYTFYATIDLCGQIFLGVGRTWTPMQAGMLPAYSDNDGRNDFISSATQAVILLQRCGATLNAKLTRVCKILSDNDSR
jgi:hypothetical protein